MVIVLLSGIVAGSLDLLASLFLQSALLVFLGRVCTVQVGVSHVSYMFHKIMTKKKTGNEFGLLTLNLVELSSLSLWLHSPQSILHWSVSSVCGVSSTNSISCGFSCCILVDNPERVFDCSWSSSGSAYVACAFSAFLQSFNFFVLFQSSISVIFFFFFWVATIPLSDFYEEVDRSLLSCWWYWIGALAWICFSARVSFIPWNCGKYMVVFCFLEPWRNFSFFPSLQIWSRRNFVTEKVIEEIMKKTIAFGSDKSTDLVVSCAPWKWNGVPFSSVSWTLIGNGKFFFLSVSSLSPHVVQFDTKERCDNNKKITRRRNEIFDYDVAQCSTWNRIFSLWWHWSCTERVVGCVRKSLQIEKEDNKTTIWMKNRFSEKSEYERNE